MKTKDNKSVRASALQITLSVALISLSAILLVIALASGGNAVAGGAPAQAPLTTVTTSLSKNPANPGDIVVVTAHATVKGTGFNVPSSPGELDIQVCQDFTTLDYVAAANCDSLTPTGIWEILTLNSPPPPIVSFNWNTAGEAGQTIGFRGLYIPKGSGYAGAAGSAVNLVVNATTPTPTPPPTPTPTPTPSPDFVVPSGYTGTSVLCSSLGNCDPYSPGYATFFHPLGFPNIVHMRTPSYCSNPSVSVVYFREYEVTVTGGSLTGFEVLITGQAVCDLYTPPSVTVTGSFSGCQLTLSMSNGDSFSGTRVDPSCP